MEGRTRSPRRGTVAATRRGRPGRPANALSLARVLLLHMTDSDARLVQSARGGDVEAFDQLVRRHARAAYSVALSVLVDPHDAEDACQDAFLLALQRIEQCRDPDRFSGWLLQIVRNRSRNVRRSREARPALRLESMDSLAGASRPAHEAHRSEVRGRLIDAMTALTEVQREVLLLHDLEGWRHREIAAALELPEGTVRYHLFQARRTLRPLLRPLMPEEDSHGR